MTRPILLKVFYKNGLTTEIDIGEGFDTPDVVGQQILKQIALNQNPIVTFPSGGQRVIRADQVQTAFWNYEEEVTI